MAIPKTAKVANEKNLGNQTLERLTVIFKLADISEEENIK